MKTISGQIIAFPDNFNVIIQQEQNKKVKLKIANPLMWLHVNDKVSLELNEYSVVYNGHVI